MLEQEVLVTFQPSGKTVYVLKGTRLVEAAAGAGITLDVPCGGEGTCGKCRVIVRRGACPATPAELELLSEQELAGGYRLACQSLVCGPTTVEIPESSLLAAHHKILTQSQTATGLSTDPVIHKRYVEMPPPDRTDDRADLARLSDAVGPLEADLELVRKIPGLLRDSNYRGTAVLADGRLIDFEPGNTEAECFAVALDIGTTTLVAMLLDLNGGAELGVASRLNPQTSFGDDVLSRILHAREKPQGLNELHETVIEAVDDMIGELAEQAAVRRERIYEATFSGNTTMQQLLCRIDPRWLGEVPFVAAVGDRVLAPAVRLGIHIHPRGRVYVMPIIGGFVGGDTVSGIIAAQLNEAEGPTLLVDIGTNGEIVLFADGKLLAAATAAGPAFEGAGISHGMRGSTGAVEKVIGPKKEPGLICRNGPVGASHKLNLVPFSGRLRTNVIGNVAPVGLCGSALIDLAAELLRFGVLTPEGRLLSSDELPDNLPDDLRRRVIGQGGSTAFVLVSESETGTGKDIVVTQRDFRQLQLAGGAIRAGIAILLGRVGLRPEELDGVLIGGGFGNFIRRSNAQRIGLLPPEIQRHRIRYLGNTSLAGARLVAISKKARKSAEDLARRTEHIDLSTDPNFQMIFAEAMIFPSDEKSQQRVES